MTLKIIYLNSIVVYIENNSNLNLKCRNILIIKENSVLLEIFEIYGNVLKCVSIGDNSTTSKSFTVEYYLPCFSLDIYDEIFGSLIDPLGRIIKTVHGHIEKKNPYKAEEIKNIRYNDVLNPMSIITTGIKAIDFYAPYTLGSKIGFLGGAGTGKTMLLLEILYNTQRRLGMRTAFAGVGERAREGEELYRSAVDTGLINSHNPSESKTALIYGTMDAHPAIRAKAAWGGLMISEYLRDIKNENSVLMVDNIYRLIQADNEIMAALQYMISEGGYQPTLFNMTSRYFDRVYSSASKGSVTALMTVYLPADDMNDPAVLSCTRHFNTFVTLDRTLASMKIYPSIKPEACYSNALCPEIVGDRHYKVYLQVMGILERYAELENIVNMIGLDELNDDDIVTYKRAKLIYNFNTQPMHVTEMTTMIPGIYVEREDTIQSFEKIISGAYDDIQADKFYYIGSL